MFHGAAMERLDEIRDRLAEVADPIAMLEGIFAFSPFGLQIYTADGHSKLTNRAFREMFGSEPPPEYCILHDEIAQRTGRLDLIHRAFAGETVQVPAIWYDPRELKQVSVTEGRRVAMTCTFFPLFDRDGKVAHVAIVFRDETSEITLREQVTAERDLFRAIIEQTGDGIIVADADGVLRIFNSAAERQHGRPLREVPASEWAGAYGLLRTDGSPLPLEETPLYRALGGERIEDAHWRVRRPDGSTAALSGTATPVVRADGTRAGAVLTTRDETERLRFDEELRRTLQFLERLVAILGHDLRNPLSAILVAAQSMLRRGDLGSAQGKLLSRIISSADRMERMITDLLDFTRGRLGTGLPLSPADADMIEICRHVLEELELSHPTRVLRLRIQGDARGRWDADRVAQVVSNLVSNALQYSPPEATVTVALHGEPHAVVLHVTNQGPPIPPPLLARIFDPFLRGRESHGRHGLGLGLYIVERIVRAHGGEVAVRSTETDGTTFSVHWPRIAPVRETK
jgi:signal transduction histidine kinase